MRDASDDDPEPPLATILAAAFMAWLCAGLTLAALGLREALLGPPGWVAAGALALTAIPFVAWPDRTETVVGYLAACVLALVAIPVGLWAGLL